MPTVSRQKSERLVARLGTGDKDLLKKAASLSGQSVASFVVIHARTAAERAIEQQERITLNTAESERFIRALQKAPAPTKRAKRALANYRKTVTEH